MTARNKCLVWLIAVSIAQGGAAWSAYAADIQMQVQAAPTTQGSPSPTGKLLTIEDAVRIGLDNHPRIKSANERIGSQQAVLGQQMAAYYPTISLSNIYRSGTASGTTGVSATGVDFFQSQASF
ncbi:MAG TPA: TolC family protein, partial [Candidatus Binatia bacterium]|nr:TolC family protein [Candidatus Binatia bacterium]